MGINTSCPCTNIPNPFDNDDETTTSSPISNKQKQIQMKFTQLPKSEVVCSQKATSQTKQTKICIIPTNMLDLCFQTTYMLALNKEEDLFYERVVICNYLNSLLFAIVIFQSEKGKEDSCSDYFKRKNEYTSIYQTTAIQVTSDNSALIKEKLNFVLNNMLNQEYYLIGVICVDNSEYKLLFKQKSIYDKDNSNSNGKSNGNGNGKSNSNVIDLKDDKEDNSTKAYYHIEVFESNHNMINKKEIETMIEKHNDKEYICFIQYSYKEADKSAFFFIYSNNTYNSNELNDDSITNNTNSTHHNHQYKKEIRVKEYERNQISTERYIKNMAEQVNQCNITSAFGSNDCIYITNSNNG